MYPNVLGLFNIHQSSLNYMKRRPRWSDRPFPFEFFDVFRRNRRSDQFDTPPYSHNPLHISSKVWVVAVPARAAQTSSQVKALGRVRHK